jgi:hypothetical protein
VHCQTRGLLATRVSTGQQIPGCDDVPLSLGQKDSSKPVVNSAVTPAPGSGAAMNTVACDVGNSSQVWLLAAHQTTPVLIYAYITTIMYTVAQPAGVSVTQLPSLNASRPVSTIRGTSRLRSFPWTRRPCGAVPARRTPWRAPRWRHSSKAAPSASAGVGPSENSCAVPVTRAALAQLVHRVAFIGEGALALCLLLAVLSSVHLADQHWFEAVQLTGA